MLITEATISIVCLIVIVYTAVRYYSGVGRRRDTYEGSVYMLMLVFAMIHIAADGILRIQVSEPAMMSVKSINNPYILLYYIAYICGLVFTVQMSADAIIVNSKTHLSKKIWVLLHIPAAVIVGVSVAMPGRLGLPLIRYASLFVAIVIFIFTAWFYERMESDLRRAMVEVIVGCIIIFVCYFVLRISVIPAVASILLPIIGFGSLRGEVADLAEEDEDDENIEEPHNSDKVRLAYDPLTKTDINKVKEDKKARKEAEKEAKKARKKAKKEEYRKLQESLFGSDDEDKQADKNIEEKAELSDKNTASETISESQENILEQTVEGATEKKTEESQVAEPEKVEEKTSVSEPPVRKEPKTPPEPIKVSDEDLASLQHMERTVAVEMRVQPLIMEKDLKDNYHRLGECATEGDIEGCEKIIETLSGYRISGIHVTRFGRIKNAVAQKDLKTVIKEVEGF